MESIKKFFEKYFVTIVTILLFFSFFNNCSRDRRISKIEKNISFMKDSTYSKQEFKRELQIMGLEAEKRMIQATDRRMLDLNRQNDIEVELKKLKNDE